jgi:nucleotide-binding universal stress UspA family protein
MMYERSSKGRYTFRHTSTMAQTSYDNGLGSVVECTQAQLSKMLKPPTALVRSVAEQLQEARFVTTMAVTDGDPRRMIVSYAAKLRCDCIVMGSHGHRGVDRLLMSSVSETRKLR